MNILTAAETDEEIMRLLTWFVMNVIVKTKINLTDINVYAETFIIPVLNPILGCNLVNLNTYEDENYPGIDLGDRDAKIAVQVTSTNVRKKMDDTIKKFEKREEYLNYEKLYVATLSHEKPRYADFVTNEKYDFSPQNVLSLNELLPLVYKLTDEHKRMLLQTLRKTMNVPGDNETKISVEDFLVNKFFEQIVELAKEEEGDNGNGQEDPLPNNGDLDLKKVRFEKYWNYIEDCYRDVMQLQQEKLFRKAFERLDSSERIQLQQFLARASEKALLKTDNPVDALEIVKKDILARASISLLSEAQVENYLYYQLYMCKLLPNPKELINA